MYTFKANKTNYSVEIKRNDTEVSGLTLGFNLGGRNRAREKRRGGIGGQF
jgi:hypothetical protein